MAAVTTENTYSLRLSEDEAGALLEVLSLVGGPVDKFGRRECDTIFRALDQAGARRRGKAEGEVRFE